MRTAYQQLDALEHRRRLGFGESKMRARYLTVAAVLLLLISAGQTLGAELTAAGLWQSLDEDSHQPNAWFLIRDNGGLYEGTIVRMFMKPGENPNVVCDLCKDDRRG